MSVKMMSWANAPLKSVELGGDKGFSGFVFSPAITNAGFRINAAGSMEGSEGALTWSVPAGTWLLAGPASIYGVMAEQVGGVVPDGSAVDVWLNCGTTRSWTLTKSGIGVVTSELLVKLRHSASGVELDSCTVNLSARVEAPG